MDFGPMYDEISALTPFEEMLLAKVSTLVSVCTLTSTGFLSYQGHCVSFFQNSVQWLYKLMKVHKHYHKDMINIDEDYLRSLPDNDVPSDVNIIEREMDDLINIKKDLFDTWMELAKPIGNHLLQFFF